MYSVPYLQQAKKRVKVLPENMIGFENSKKKKTVIGEKESRGPTISLSLPVFANPNSSSIVITELQEQNKQLQVMINEKDKKIEDLSKGRYYSIKLINYRIENKY